jgi:phage FluMu gp28-like protein
MELYPYQRRWIDDKSRLKIAVKSRRIGYSFADDVLDCAAHIVVPLPRNGS